MEFTWGFATATDPTLRIAGYVGSGALLFAALLVIVTFAVRASFLLRVARRARAFERWRPILAAVVLGDRDAAKALQLAKSEQVMFFEEWNKRHTQLRGDATENLNALLRDTGLDRAARRLLTRGSHREQLLAIITLGQLADAHAWDALVERLTSDDSIHSIAAARALLQVDVQKAGALVLGEAMRRDDWPITRLASILDDTDTSVICTQVSAQARDAPADQLPWLLGLLNVMECPADLDAILCALDTSDDVETVTACLKLIDDPRGLSIARWYANDERWPVRLQAARALGRIGKREDVGVLTKLLGDPVWWVRYRAAESISAMPFLSDEDLEALQRDNEDRFARDILAQVISARGLD